MSAGISKSIVTKKGLKMRMSHMRNSIDINVLPHINITKFKTPAPDLNDYTSAQPSKKNSTRGRSSMSLYKESQKLTNAL